MKKSTKINLAIIGVLAATATITTVALVGGSPSTPDPAPTGGSAPAALEVVAPNSHVLDDPEGAQVTLVEFLDFECEVCGAFYPYVEQIREDYAGDIRYVQRYFPIPSHLNSMNAALAVEAAGQQGRYEDMYHRMFETQPEWGDQQDSKAALFREFAVDLGLDMGAFDAAVADPATQERVQSDFDAGLELGVQGTPTFFIDGVPVELQSIDDLASAVDAAVAE